MRVTGRKIDKRDKGDDMAGVGILLDSETCEQFRIGRVRVSVGNGAEDVEQLRMDGSGPQHLAVAEPIGAELRERNGVRYADALHGTLDQLDKGRGGCIVLPDKTTNGIVFGKFANGACGIGSEQRGALEGGIRAAIRGSARFRIDRDGFTVLDALSLAGDLTIDGQRENVTLIRHEGTREHTYTLDLTHASALYASPAFYVQQGDIIYVTPNDKRIRESTINGNNVRSTSFWISIASLATSVALLVFRLF